MARDMSSMVIDGVLYPLRYTRRKYGSKTYTWIETTINGENRDLGDPWPTLNPKRSEIEETLRRYLEPREERRAVGLDGTKWTVRFPPEGKETPQ